MTARQFLRQLKSRMSVVQDQKSENGPVRVLFNKGTHGNVSQSSSRAKVAYSWNSTTIFLAVAIMAVLSYSVVQLGISVYLDRLSTKLQRLREEEIYLVEENQFLESKIAKNKSKIRVEIVAEDDLGMRKSSPGDLVYVKDTDVSAEIYDIAEKNPGL